MLTPHRGFDRCEAEHKGIDVPNVQLARKPRRGGRASVQTAELILVCMALNTSGDSFAPQMRIDSKFLGCNLAHERPLCATSSESQVVVTEIRRRKRDFRFTASSAQRA